MDQQLLKTFLEVAATGSFGAAAGRLFVTQSAVSLRVQRLEDQLGRPLFERTKGGVSLTPAGREFRGFATTILRNWEHAAAGVGAGWSAACAGHWRAIFAMAAVRLSLAGPAARGIARRGHPGRDGAERNAG